MIEVLKMMLPKNGNKVPVSAVIENLLDEGEILRVGVRENEVVADGVMYNFLDCLPGERPRKRHFKNVPLKRYKNEIIQDVYMCVLNNA